MKKYLQKKQKKWRHVILTLCFVIGCGVIILSKEKSKGNVKINYSADKLEGREKKDNIAAYKQLVGHVIFTHEDFTIYADSAQYYDQEGIVKAMGNLEMVDKEGGEMLAGHVIYDVNKKLAFLRDSVIYQKDTLTFFTNELDYHVKAKKSYFRKGGTLIQGEDKIQSQSGSYDEKKQIAVFQNQVYLFNETYQVQCDILHYNTSSQLAEFKGKTYIVSKDGETIQTPVGGQYNAKTKDAIFKRARLDAEKISLYSNLIKANQEKNHYTLIGQVAIYAKEHQSTISGAYGYYDQEQGIGQITGDPLLEKVMDDDTLFMKADTLLAVEDKGQTFLKQFYNTIAAKPQQDEQVDDSAKKKYVIFAQNNVSIYKNNLQGKAGTVAYLSLDSSVYFINNPIFWSYDNQITAEVIRMTLSDKNIEKMYMNGEAFLISQDAIGNYNQIKGREMIAQFQDNKMEYIDILGNGQSLYFALDDSLALVGMNYICCSHMRIDLAAETLSKISFFVKPVGTFYPLEKIKENEKQLPNFNWRAHEKPLLSDFLNIKDFNKVNKLLNMKTGNAKQK